MYARIALNEQHEREVLMDTRKASAGRSSGSSMAKYEAKAQLLKKREENKKIIEQAMLLAQDMQELGSGLLVEMKKQKEQMLRGIDRVNAINANMDRADVTLKKMMK
jgi:hypothetical protein